MPVLYRKDPSLCWPPLGWGPVIVPAAPALRATSHIDPVTLSCAWPPAEWERPPTEGGPEPRSGTSPGPSTKASNAQLINCFHQWQTETAAAVGPCQCVNEDTERSHSKGEPGDPRLPPMQPIAPFQKAARFLGKLHVLSVPQFPFCFRELQCWATRANPRPASELHMWDHVGVTEDKKGWDKTQVGQEYSGWG